MAKKYRAEQFLSLSGSECGTEIEIRQLVTFTVDPGYPETKTTPGEPATVDNVVIRYFIGEHPGCREVTLPGHVTIDFEESREFQTWLLGQANGQEQEQVDDAADREPEEFTGFSCEAVEMFPAEPARA